ncbi:poly(A)-specific ribonuclease PARN-like isoform X2 [Prorops nasuta]|uniref:poly(A)-specific ribonuclease PARN-like isoform X2 n=1 Tax=Prorops nasuta TaxID=863751 RepID=UPI0034CD94C7
MEVTRINFQEVLKELDNVLEKAAFLGIDGEFTGLNSGPEARAFDTPVQYYDKLRSGSMDFLLVQFGLSVFTYDSNANKYSQQSYNFYVFPRPLNRSAPDCRFMCQASSISFLANQGFDFNKLFKLGIPYLTTAEEEKLSKRLEDKHKVRDEGPEVIQISDHDKPQIEEICSQIEEFLSSDAEELMIDRCNAFIRRIVHQEVKIRWPNKLRLDCKTDFSRQYLIVQKAGTKEEELELEKEKREKEKQEVQDAFGLSALLKKIADSGKLLVGHNMLLDLCHIVHQFFAPLPESYTEFKALVHNLFPRLLDTKVMCESKQFKDLISSSNLYIMQERMSKKPFSIPEIEAVEGRSYDISEEKTHEAGYDAFITGICFIAMINYLGSVTNPEVTMVHPDSPLLTRYINKLLIPRLKDFPYVNLEGKDPDTNRDNVFHLTFPKTWKYSDITQLFNPYGGVYVSWLSETTAYVALNRRDQISTVMKNLGGSKIYRLRKYSDHQAASQKSALNKQGNKKSNQKEGKAEKKEKLESVLPSTGNIGAKEEEEEDGGWEVATGKRKRKRKVEDDQGQVTKAKKKPFDEDAAWS